jgi:hypothetical protein
VRSGLEEMVDVGRDRIRGKERSIYQRGSPGCSVAVILLRT